MKYLHTKLFEEFRGLDLRSAEETRPRGFARRFENMMHTAQGEAQQRYGTQVRTKLDNVGSLGVWPFQATDMLQNERDYILGAGSDTLANNHNLYRRVTNTATFTNSHASQAATVSMYYDSATSQFRFKIIRGGSTILDQGLGDGLGSAYTLASLITAVNAVASCNLAASGGTTGQACFLDIVADEVVAAAGGTLSITYYSWTAVNVPQFRWPINTGSVVSAANDTIDLSQSLESVGRVQNPFKDGDPVFFVVDGAGSMPSPLVEGTTYYVRDATSSTFKLAATAGGSAINLTTTGSGSLFLCASFNPNATFWNYAVELGRSTFRPASSVLLRNVRYFAPGRVTAGTGGNSQPYRETASLAKYDGQSFYRAGLPKCDFISLTLGTVTSGNWTDARGTKSRANVSSSIVDGMRYRFQYKYVDKAGNIIEGELSKEFVITKGSSPDDRVVKIALGDSYDLWLISRLGFNSNYGQAGSGTTLTPTVTDGYGNDHTLKVGDIAYFFDNGQGRFIQREITAVTSSTITISSQSLDTEPLSPNFDLGGTPTFNSATSISANLRIVVWRAQASGANSVKYFVEEIPWCPSQSNYYDDKDNTALGATLVEPAYAPNLPPPCRFLATFNEQLILTGNDAKNRTIFFEDIETLEGVPSVTHQFDLPTKATGVRQSGPVLIGTTKASVHEVAGDLAEFRFKVTQIGQKVGCLAHESMQEIEEGVLVFASAKGPYVLYNGRRLEPLGAIKLDDNNIASRLEPYFTADYSAANPRPFFERATSVILPAFRWYVLFIPVESTVVPTFSAQSQTLGSGSLCFVYDYGRGAWYRWLGVDFSSVCEKDDVLHFCTRKYDGAGSADFRDLLGYYGTMLTTKGKYNYCDHATPTVWQWQAHNEHLGRPSILKKALRCRVKSSGRPAASSTFDVNSYINCNPSLQSTDDTLTFASEDGLTPKLTSEKIKAIMMEFTGSRPYEPIPIAGFELEMVAPFREVLKE